MNLNTRMIPIWAHTFCIQFYVQRNIHKSIPFREWTRENNNCFSIQTKFRAKKKLLFFGIAKSLCAHSEESPKRFMVLLCMHMCYGLCPLKRKKMAVYASRSFYFFIKSYQLSAIIHGMKVKILINYGRRATKNIRCMVQ